MRREVGCFRINNIIQLQRSADTVAAASANPMLRRRFLRFSTYFQLIDSWRVIPARPAPGITVPSSPMMVVPQSCRDGDNFVMQHVSSAAVTDGRC